MSIFLAAADPIDEALPYPLFHLAGNVYFTNQMLMALVAAILMLLLFPTIFKNARGDAPSGSRNFFESIMEYLRIEVFRPALKENTDRFVPFLWTMFFFILFCNLIGQLPINEVMCVLTGREFHFMASATGQLAVTGGLAICSFFCIHVNGLWEVARALMNGTYGHHAHHEEHSTNGGPGHEAAIDLEHMRGDALGADIPGDLRAIGDPTKHYQDDEFPSLRPKPKASGHSQPGMSAGQAWTRAVPLYLWNFAPHPFKPQPGESKAKWLMDVPFFLFLLVLELLGAVIKPFALMIRLFANMVSGHVALAALIMMIPLTAGLFAQLGLGLPVTVLSLMIRMVELFVAFLQSYIFVFLTTLFLASAVAPEH